MTTNAEIVNRLERVADRAEIATDAYKEVLVSEGDKDILLVDGTTTPNLNKRVSGLVSENIDSKLAASANGQYAAYATLDEAILNSYKFPKNRSILVTNDGDKSGLYLWNGANLIKSTYDPLEQSKTYTNSEVSKLDTKLTKSIGDYKNITVSFKGSFSGTSVNDHLEYGYYYLRNPIDLPSYFTTGTEYYLEVIPSSSSSGSSIQTLRSLTQRDVIAYRYTITTGWIKVTNEKDISLMAGSAISQSKEYTDNAINSKTLSQKGTVNAQSPNENFNIGCYYSTNTTDLPEDYSGATKNIIIQNMKYGSQTLQTIINRNNPLLEWRRFSGGAWFKTLSLLDVDNLIKENPKLSTNVMQNINVDTLLDVGVYSVTRAIGTIENGFPVNADGTIFVDRIANNSRLQIFYTLSPVRMFIRTKSVNFTEWVEMATKADISNEVRLQSERLASEKIKGMYSVPDISMVTANNYAVATEDLKGGFKLLVSKNHTSKKAPASMTKVLTAITALEQGVLIGEEFTVDQEDIVVGSGYNLKAGDIITLEDLLYDMMLPSSNIAANCVARIIGGKLGGGTEKFIEKMNQKRQELGMLGSTFFNPSGLGQSGQITTCEDMTRLGLYAIKNSELAKIWGTPERSMNIKGPNARIETIKTSVIPISDDSAWCYGGKTGTLGDFFNMITSVTLENGYKGIVVTMGSNTSEDRPKDHEKLAMYCKNSFRYPTPSEITKI